MESKKFTLNSKERIKICLQDYGTNFLVLKMSSNGGIEYVREIIKNGYKFLTIEEYIEECKKKGKEPISIEDQQNILFIEKAKILNDLANKLNTLGEGIDEQTATDSWSKVEGIMYN